MSRPAGRVARRLAVALLSATLVACAAGPEDRVVLLPGPDGKALLALHVEDYDFATSILNRSGFKLMYEADLLR
jgi:hypothetical protein